MTARIRHSIANVFYALGRVFDAVPARCDGDMIHAGNRGDYSPADQRDTSGNFQVHLRDGTPVTADFKPPSYGYVYAALHVGRGVQTTFFLTRNSTRNLLNALRHIESQFNRYGEGRRFD